MRSWIVTARFFTDALQLTAANPLLDITKTSLGFDVFQRYVDRDIFGAPIATTMGEPQGGVEVDDSRPVFTITKNEAFVNVAVVMAYKDAVNLNGWRGIAPRCAKIKSISSSEIQIRNGQQFYTLTYEVHVNLDSYDLKFLNKGRFYRKTAGGSARKIPNNWTDVIIDIRNDTIATANTPIQYRFRTQRVYKEVDFNFLIP